MTSNDRRDLKGVGVKLTFDERCVIHSGAEYEKFNEGKKPEAMGNQSVYIKFYRLRKKGENFRFPIILTTLKEAGVHNIDVEVSCENIRNFTNSELGLAIVDKDDQISHDWDYFNENRYMKTK